MSSEWNRFVLSISMPKANNFHFMFIDLFDWFVGLRWGNFSPKTEQPNNNIILASWFKEHTNIQKIQNASLCNFLPSMEHWNCKSFFIYSWESWMYQVFHLSTKHPENYVQICIPEIAVQTRERESDKKRYFIFIFHPIWKVRQMLPQWPPPLLLNNNGRKRNFVAKTSLSSLALFFISLWCVRGFEEWRVEHWKYPQSLHIL